MRIIFTNLSGFENIVWNYNKQNNRATYKPPVATSPEKVNLNQKIQVPEGIVMDEAGVWVIDKADDFMKAHQYKVQEVPSLFQQTLFTESGKPRSGSALSGGG